MRRRIGQQGRELSGIGRGLRGVGLEIVGIGAVEDQEFKPAQMQPIGRRAVGAIGHFGARIEEPHPTLAAAFAHLVIAAHHNPRRGLEERRRRIEEIGLPSGPIVAVRAPGAALVAGRTGGLAIVVVADMDHQIGLVIGGVLGDVRKRPLLGVVAILQRRPLDAAAGVADDRDPVDRSRQNRNRKAADGELRRRQRDRGAAHGDREIAVSGAALGRLDGRAVGDDLGAGGDAGADDDPHGQLVVGAEFDPGPGDNMIGRGGIDGGGDHQRHHRRQDRDDRTLHTPLLPPPRIAAKLTYSASL
jgi:hypothetical protein